jgi:hypothetical protein
MRVDPTTSENNRRAWLGMAITNPGEFYEKLSADPTILFKQMNQNDRTFIRNLYEKMLKNPQADPRVTTAEGWLRDAFGNILTELGVDRLQRGKNDTDYYSFRAGILTALEEWMAKPSSQGKMPTRDQFTKEIAPDILKQKPQSWTNWLTFGLAGEEGQEPFWKNTAVPEEWEKQRRREIMIDRGIPEEDIPRTEIQRDYVHYLFKQSVMPKPQRVP